MGGVVLGFKKKACDLVGVWWVRMRRDVGARGAMVFDLTRLPSTVPAEVAGVFALAGNELGLTDLDGASRRDDLQKVRDQLLGGELATSERYHPNQAGLSVDRQRRFRETLRRSHVNLVEPALDRLVNSIHSGRIRRRVKLPHGELQAAIKGRAHAEAMAKLCENAYAYGTGYLVPLWVDGALKYWLMDPVHTVMVVNAVDIAEVLGLIEVKRDRLGQRVSFRYVTKKHRGFVIYEEARAGVAARVHEGNEEHGCGFVPAVVARGRDRTHQGEKYGRSLVLGVAEATVRVTNNEVNLELLRDKQTQALLVVLGEPNRTSVDDEDSDQKYIQFPRDGGSAEYKTPDSRLAEVIRVTERFCEDAAIASGLPLDTFLPSLIAGADASATAARIRAFPLQQKMSRLVNAWEAVEELAIAVVGAVMAAGDEAGRELLGSLEAWVRYVGPLVSIRPSLPEADSETLANWQQKTANFMAPIEDAIEYYGQDLDEETRAALALAWRVKNDPTSASGGEVFQYHVEGGVLTVNEVRGRLGLGPVAWGDVTVPELRANPAGEDALQQFKRDVTKALYGGAATKEVMANLTNLRALLGDVELPLEPGYEEPFLPVIAGTGPVVTGEVLRDSEGDIVGGVAVDGSVKEGEYPAEAQSRGEEQQEEQDPADPASPGATPGQEGEGKGETGETPVLHSAGGSGEEASG
jgi:hypothetical protein